MRERAKLLAASSGRRDSYMYAPASVPTFRFGKAGQATNRAAGRLHATQTDTVQQWPGATLVGALCATQAVAYRPS